jgi:hypothetical protein
MYNIRQFKSALYLLVFMGIGGFALATNSAATFVLGGGAVAINAWLVKTGRFRPMPRLLSNLVTLAGLPWVIVQTRASGFADEVVWIGQYLVLLQVVKLFEQRGNRDYAQLLVLGLLLMVAAAIDTASLAFGALLIVYLFLSLYCSLLFHLKVEADQAKSALAIPDDKLDSATLRQDQRYMTRSMRQMTALVAGVALVFAVTVFLFFPRGSGDGLLGSRQFRPEQALTGFNTEVSFQQVAKIAQSNEVVAFVQLWENDTQINGGQTLLLRGLTLERYHGADAPDSRRWTWTHRQSNNVTLVTTHDAVTQLAAPAVGGGDVWRQKITLRPTGTNALFAMAGPLSITTRRPYRIDYLPGTGALRTLAPLVEPIDYEVCSSNSLDSPADADTADTSLEDDDSFGASRIDPQVLAFAGRPEVCGQNAAGPLAAQRARFPRHVDPLDEQIASNIQTYLRTHYAYTLDLTDAASIEGRDPIVAFLYDFKRGHCEYFAGAMTLLCQSLGMQARMVVGFKCNEFSNIGSHYIVRESDAHSWVEVRTASGWKSFDPTSGTAADLATRPRGGLWQDATHVIDYLEYTYADNVIAYDSDDRTNLIQTAESGMFSAATNSHDAFGKLGTWARSSTALWNFSTTFLGASVWVMVLILLAAFVGFFWERWQLRRRAARMGIKALPAAEQQRLARQLAFYDHLTLMLGRHHLVRPKHLTPLEFCRSLHFLPSDLYDTIGRLTALFYRVRFGRAQLSAGQRRRLDVVLARLNERLNKSTAAPQE